MFIHHIMTILLISISWTTNFFRVGTLVLWVHDQAWLPDGYNQIFRSYVFGPSGFWTMALVRYAASFDPFLSFGLRQGGRGGGRGSNFAIWQPWLAHLLRRHIRGKNGEPRRLPGE